MTKGMRGIVFSIGFLVALFNYINLGVFDIVKDSIKPNSALYVMAGPGLNDNVFIALGFALVYCLIGGAFAMMGAHLYIYICNVLGVSNRLLNVLKPTEIPGAKKECTKL
jgi:hypothetical protein